MSRISSKDSAVACDRLDDLISACERRAGLQSFDSTNAQQLAAVSLLGTVLELAGDCLALLRSRRRIGPKVLLRSLMEAWVELKNVARDPDYLGFMNAVQLELQLRRIDAASQADAELNPYFEDLRANEDLESRRGEFKRDLEALKAHGFGRLSIRDRFRRAGEGQRYESVYALLAQHSHHNLIALERRHVVRSEDGPRIAFFKPEEEASLVAEIDTVAGVVSNAVAEVSRLADGGPIGLEEISQRLETLRSAAFPPLRTPF